MTKSEWRKQYSEYRLAKYLLGRAELSDGYCEVVRRVHLSVIICWYDWYTIKNARVVK